MDRSSRRVSAAALLLLSLPLGTARLLAQEPPPDEEKKPFSEVIDVPDRDLKDLLGKPPLPDGIRAANGGGGACYTQMCNPSYCPLSTQAICLLQTFQEVQWRICAYPTASKGLAVGLVDLKRTPLAPWRRLIYKAGVAEYFTPYHTTLADRLYDTQWGSVNSLDEVSPDDAGANGVLIPFTGETTPKVVAECRDRGVAWMCKGNLYRTTRRGQELTLWGIYDTGNYEFLQEYSFRDDGSISFRTGATGYNYQYHPDEAHMHNTLWRIDMDLNGPAGDTPYKFDHIEPSLPFPNFEALDMESLHNGGHEGPSIWYDRAFNTLVVRDTLANAFGQKMGYEFEPIRTGSARHLGYWVGLPETWNIYDFWVTRWHSAEDVTMLPWTVPDNYLLPQTNGETTVSRDNVVWYKSSAHHEPSSEDRDLGGLWAVTLTHWYGFELHPHDYFDFNPLGGPSICDN